MGFTAADLAAIRAAIAKGEQSVQYADRLVSYRSVDDLLKAEQRIAASLAGRSKQVLGYSEKGLRSVS